MLDYKIKLVHLFSKPEDEREVASFKSISPLQNFGIEYVKNVNPPYEGLPPAFNCSRPQDISKEPGFMKITGRHYGCFMAFRNAIEQYFEDEDDFLIICECDCILEVSHEDFIQLLNKVCRTMIETKIDYFSFGDKYILSSKELVSPIVGEIQDVEYMYITNKIIGCQMIMFPKSSKKFLKEIFLGESWDGIDLYFNRVFNKYKKRIGIINERVTTQHEGVSLLDNKMKLFTDNKSMIEKLLELYEKVEINHQEVRQIKNQISCSFVKNPKVTISGPKPEKYRVTFIDIDLNETLYQTEIQTGWFSTTNREWYTKWNIKVENIRTKEIELDYTLNLENKRVYISFESKSLGDTLAWIPYVEEFRKKHNCILFVSTHWNNLFKTEYPSITFTEPGTRVDNLLAMYFIGIFNSGVWNPNKNPNDCRLIPLQKVSSDILGLEYEEIKPKIKLSNKKKNIYKRYVCIAPNATMQCKYWNYKGGWQKIVDYLKSIGYEVMLISKEKDYMGNTAPYRVIDKSGNRMIEDRILDLQYADLYIGLGSGLSWLSWAIGTPTIMLTGYTEPWYEFQSETIIHNNNVCNGCFNDSSIPFEKHWNWCPRNKNFECTSTIEPEQVIDAINKTLKR